MRHLGILEKQLQAGFPRDYLLARLKGRKPLLWAGTAREARPSSEDENLLWRSLLAEAAWVYRQLEPKDRRKLDPVFAWTELRTLVLCLRQMRARGPSPASELLRHSLLCHELKEILQGSGDPGSSVSALEGFFTSWHPSFAGLRQCYEKDGLRGFEAALTSRFLQTVLATPLVPEVRRYMALLVDLRNLLRLSKELRWQATQSPLLQGGTVALQRLEPLAQRGDRQGLEDLFARLTRGEQFASETAGAALARRLTRYVHQAAKEPLGLGPILEYLWGLSVRAANLRLSLYGRHLDRERLANEMMG